MLDDPTKINLYFFEEGYLRTSSNEYDVNAESVMVHLTNNCLQVQEKSTFGMHEAGNTVSFQIFQDYLDEEYPQYNLSIKEHIIPRMKDIVIDSVLATKNKINSHQRKFCFELLGFDFLIDEDFRTWLLEVNNNPFLGYQNKEQYELLSDMLNTMLKITVSPLLEQDVYLKKNYHEGTRFTMIYSDYKNINHRNSFNRQNLYPIPELNQFISRKEKEKIMTSRIHQFNSQYMKKFEKKTKTDPLKLEHDKFINPDDPSSQLKRYKHKTLPKDEMSNNNSKQTVESQANAEKMEQISLSGSDV